MGWVQLSISVAGCAGQLALVLVALRRSARSRLALLLAFLFLDIFVWNLASLLTTVLDSLAWSWLDHTASPLTVPLAVEFVLAFVGRQRAGRRRRLIWWLPFVALSIVPTIGLVSPVFHAWDHGGPWAISLAAGGAAVMAWALALLVRHLRAVADAHERARTRLVLIAAALGTALGLTDLLDNYLHNLPSLAALGFLIAGALLFVAVARARLLESDLTMGTAALALALAWAGVIACLALFPALASDTALLVLALGAVTLALLAAMTRFVAVSAERRARATRLATLGRFAAQMAHDLKNPLAALKGAAQFLRDDLPQDGSRRAKYVELMIQQVDRLEGALDGYGRLARMEPLLSPVQLNEIVREVIALQEFAAGPRIALQVELADGLPACDADRGLLANALQNLIRNSCEAIEGAGAIVVRTNAAASHRVVLSVEDNGAGMDARTREQASDEFFSNKPGGSGLGLSFVRRVAEVHGGGLTIDSELGRGTVVSLHLPLSREA